MLSHQARGKTAPSSPAHSELERFIEQRLLIRVIRYRTRRAVIGQHASVTAHGDAARVSSPAKAGAKGYIDVLSVVARERDIVEKDVNPIPRLNPLGSVVAEGDGTEKRGM